MMLSSSVLSLGVTSVAKADVIADRAAKYCKKYEKDNPRTACIFGYVEGNEYCENLKDSVTDAVRKACTDGQKKGADDRKSEEDNGAGGTTDKGDCGGVDTAIIKCNADNSGGIETNGVWALLLMAINILTAGVGIAAVGGIIYGSIMYTTAGDNEGQVKQAKEIIRNVIIGIIAYVAMYALLQFIVPGGVFS